MTPFVETCLSLSHLLVCFNSSANFVIYLLAGEKFRRVWFDTFFRKCCNNNSDSGSNQATTFQTMSTIGRYTFWLLSQETLIKNKCIRKSGYSERVYLSLEFWEEISNNILLFDFGKSLWINPASCHKKAYQWWDITITFLPFLNFASTIYLRITIPTHCNSHILYD